MPARTFRFAVGSPSEPFSAVWRLVGDKDPFLGCYRQGMGLFKISMHPDDTLVAFTAQSGAKFENGSRVDKTWPRPPEFRPGWTIGPSILVPRTSIGARALLEDLHPSVPLRGYRRLRRARPSSSVLSLRRPVVPPTGRSWSRIRWRWGRSRSGVPAVRSG